MNFTTDDYVVLPALLASTDALTVITVYRLNTGGSGSQALAVASNLLPNRNGVFHNTLSNIKFRVTESGGGMHTLQPTFSLATEGWRMLTARWESGQAQELVLNDFEDSAAAALIDVPSGTIADPYDTLGAFRTDSFLDGKLACQLLYDRYLADTEIKQNYKTLRGILSPRGNHTAMTIRLTDPGRRLPASQAKNARLQAWRRPQSADGRSRLRQERIDTWTASIPIDKRGTPDGLSRFSR